MIVINKDLKSLRLDLDNIDNKIAKLILDRVDIVKQVGAIKKQEKNKFYIPEREEEIIKKISINYPGLEVKFIRAIFTEIISSCRSYEKIFTVALKNNLLSKTAVQKIFGSFCESYFFSSVKDIDFEKTDYVVTILDGDSLELVENESKCLLLKKVVVEKLEFYLLEIIKK